jgi:hypothetical protein
MQPTSPKRAYRAWSACACFTARIFVLSLPMDFAPLSNLMNHNDLFVVKNLVNDTVVANVERTILQGRL